MVFIEHTILHVNIGPNYLKDPSAHNKKDRFSKTYRKRYYFNVL